MLDTSGDGHEAACARAFGTTGASPLPKNPSRRPFPARRATTVDRATVAEAHRLRARMDLTTSRESPGGTSVPFRRERSSVHPIRLQGHERGRDVEANDIHGSLRAAALRIVRALHQRDALVQKLVDVARQTHPSESVEHLSLESLGFHRATGCRERT